MLWVIIKILKIFKHCNPLGTSIALNNSDHSLLRISSYFLIPHVQIHRIDVSGKIQIPL